ncbi:hypothetical protein [Aeromicrobium sp. CF3.5]|uniref:hypothetical protein n=1 Tax=Aeromicrobium sp. CF3.5 TaxID=3373078 RepID=UPI003EE574C4
MPRRVSMPGADELFRATAREGLTDAPAAEAATTDDATRRLRPVDRDSSTESGRVKHDEKMTIYVTADELLAVEHARLQLRVALGRTVDRGRFVRAAVALALADLEEHGVDSQVARRLSET